MSERSRLLGREAAGKESVFPWVLFGWALAIIAVPTAHMRRPKPKEFPDVEDLDKAAFELEYSDCLKSREVKATWFGVFLALVTWFYLGSEIWQGAFEDSPSVRRAVPTVPVVPSVAPQIKEEAPKAEPEQIVTLEEFNRLEKGMTYKQVVEIIGAKGSVISEQGDHWVHYQWKNADGSSVYLDFTEGKLSSRNRVGF